MLLRDPQSKGLIMRIYCGKCGHSEKANAELFVKIIGGAMPIGGFWAWVAYFFAGTGLALPICIAMVTGGVAILIFKDQIVRWVVNQGYKCCKCGSVDWKLEPEQPCEEPSESAPV
jgi:ribosomal protein S27AE